MTELDETQFFRDRGFGQRIGFGQRPAVLVIDFINAFTRPDWMLGASLDQEIAATQSLLKAARAAGAPVIFSTVSYDDADFKDAGIWALKQKGVMTLRADSDGVALDPRLPRQAGDSLLVRNTPRASLAPIWCRA